MATYIVLIGPPGSGKGTQAKHLQDELGIPHISSGDLFRAMKEADTPLAREIRDIMAKGELVPDEITVKMVAERLREDDCQEKGAILDGFPRTVPQAEALDDLLDDIGMRVSVVLLLSITEDEAVRRISGRRVCPVCERVYHVEFNPPQEPGRCDDDGAELIQREDDRPEVVRERFRQYQKKTAPLVDYYRGKGMLTEVDAMQPIDAITPLLIDIVEPHAASN